MVINIHDVLSKKKDIKKILSEYKGNPVLIPKESVFDLDSLKIDRDESIDDSITKDTKQSNKSIDDSIAKDTKQSNKSIDDSITKNTKQSNKSIDDSITKDTKQSNKSIDDSITKDTKQSNKSIDDSIAKNTKQSNKSIDDSIAKKDFVPKRYHVVNKDTFCKLTNIQKSILMILTENLSQGNITKPISMNTLILRLKDFNINSSFNSIKKIVYRMTQYSVIAREEYSKGQQGWTIYSINLDVLESLNKHIKSIYKIPENIKSKHNIDYHLLEGVGFSQSHVNQLLKLEDITEDILQKSINHFAYDILINKKSSEINTEPLNFFMGIMRRQNFYNAPKGYTNLEDFLNILRLRKEDEEIEEDFKDWFKKNGGKTFFEWRSSIPKFSKHYKQFDPDEKLQLDAAKLYFKKNIKQLIK